MISIYDKLPINLIDRSTVLERQLSNKKNNLLTNTFPDGHTQFSHLFCILLRIFIGILILSGSLDKKYIIYLCLFIIIIFGSKFIFIKNNKDTTWKNYLKIVISYLTILIIQSYDIDNKNTISGLLIIVDAMISQQTRHATTIMSRVAPN
jgi:hypothetical protein